MFTVYLYHLVDEKERIAVRNQASYAVDVNDRLDIRIVDRRLHFCVLHCLAEHTGELVVDGMARTFCHDTPL